MSESSINLTKPEWSIFVVFPILLILLTFILRATILQNHFFDLANFTIGIILTVFVLHSLKTTTKKVILISLAFETVIIALNIMEVMSDKNINNELAVWIHTQFETNLLTRGLVGLFDGAVGVFVFLLIVRRRAWIHVNTLEQTMHNFRAIVGLTAFISIIITTGTFLIGEEDLGAAWTIRSSLLLSGFVVAGFAISLGIIFGYTKNSLLILIGCILSFVLSFFLGIVLIPFTSASTDLVFVAQFLFYTNTLLITGVIAYLITDTKHFYNKLIQRYLQSNE